MNLKRGVSPLIATIVLISFTIAIGSLVINWGKQFITAQTQGLQQAGVECQKENIEIVESKWDNTNKKLSIIIRNMGDVEFKASTINIYLDNASVYSISEDTGFLIELNKSQVKSFSFSKGDYGILGNIDTTQSKIKYIEIPSSNCPQNLYYSYNVQQ